MDNNNEFGWVTEGNNGGNGVPSDGSIDLSKYATKSNPKFTTAVSMGRVGETGANSTALGSEVEASGTYTFAEGELTVASGGNGSHAEGSRTKATGTTSHAEGKQTTASGFYSHAEGWNTSASGSIAHAEGSSTTASGSASHAEGGGAVASGTSSHAEGGNTTAIGNHSHSEGRYTIAEATATHAEGYYTHATSAFQHVQGMFNVTDVEGNATTVGKYAHIVGNGTADDARSNAHTLDWDGNAWFSGNVTVGADNKELATKEYVDSKITNGGGSSDYEIAKADARARAMYNNRFQVFSGKLIDNATYYTNADYSTSPKVNAEYAININKILDGIGVNDVFTATFKYKAHGEEAVDYFVLDTGISTGTIVSVVFYLGEAYVMFKIHVYKEYNSDMDLIDSEHCSMYMTFSNKVPIELIDEMVNSLEIDIFLGSFNFLTLDNKEVYTPTSDYHPATKKYVDETVGNGGGGNVYYTNLSNIVDTSSATSAVKGKIDVSQLTPDVSYYLYDDMCTGVYSTTAIQLYNGDTKFPSNASLRLRSYAPIINIGVKTNGNIFFLSNGIDCYGINLETYEKTVYSYGTDSKANKTDILAKTNTTEYTPTDDYNPATKKYVDEAVANVQSGGGSGDLSSYAPIDNPNFTTAISMGRRDGTTIGNNSTALGLSVEASGSNSHAEGVATTASAYGSHSEGFNTIASGLYSHVEGYMTTASGKYQHVQGVRNIEDTENKYAHIVGNGNEYADEPSNAHTLDWDGNAWFAGNVTVGADNKELATKEYVDDVVDLNDLELTNSLTIGTRDNETGGCSLSIGDYNEASGWSSVAIGEYASSTGTYSFALGYNSISEGTGSFSAGEETKAYGDCSHAEGRCTTASGDYSHAEGYWTSARKYAHAEGYYTTASGESSHAEGIYTKANGEAQHVQGKYNIEDTANTYAHIVGNGSSATRSNAHTLDWDGNAWFAGNVTIGENNEELATQEYVDGKGLTEYKGTQEEPVDLSTITNGWSIIKGYYKWYPEYENAIPCGTFMVHRFSVGTNFYITYTNGQELTRYGVNMTTKEIRGFRYTCANEVLTKTNTLEFTPTEDYHPATKKYVDETVASVSASAVNAVSTEYVDGLLARIEALEKIVADLTNNNE